MKIVEFEMFDNLFGSGEEEEKLREELEEKDQEISDLEEKIDELEEKLRKEKERAKEAKTEKQSTDKELNEAQHKIESLRDKVERLENERDQEKLTKKVKEITNEEAISLLDELGNLEADGKYLVTHYVKNPEEAGEEALVRTLRSIDSSTGYVYLSDRFEVVNCVIVPPLPVESDEFYREAEFKLDDLRAVLKKDSKILFVSVHAGKSAIGLLSGRDFEIFDVISSAVKSKHSKGGFSQGRFQRGRDEQIWNHLDDIIDHIEEIEVSPDYVLLDGNERMISELKEELSPGGSVIERSLNIGKVNAGDKEEYLEKIWKSRLYIL